MNKIHIKYALRDYRKLSSLKIMICHCFICVKTKSCRLEPVNIDANNTVTYLGVV